MTRRTESGKTPQEATDEAVLRRTRFGALPERIRPEDTVETKPATLPDPARDAYNPDEWLVRYCL
ncbi:hypothetical protein AV521_14125 [Streptomyces sp. IMTB 2501]|uniref:hypothetical protein n=1 Tax=Streptomyces sp. IMTB 2501 TaxID=1776340 RepID=UPI00096E16E0|nr:hypothetical protein [Streptomyces sp. IMTB 2501]OLZ70289.1 hypothetical protein AV521_14125 [Streptomyces sp. IMTB 2501]